MKFKTLTYIKSELSLIEVELHLLSGLPAIHFLGESEKYSRELFYKLKTAFSVQGFKFLSSHQLVIQYSRQDCLKNAKAIELVIALAILHLTEQREMSDKELKSIIWGELDLNGSVKTEALLETYPQFLNDFNKIKSMNNEIQNFDFLSGYLPGSIKTFEGECGALNTIKDDVSWVKQQSDHSSESQQDFILQKTKNLQFNSSQSEFIFLVAVTGLHALLAGSSGGGKTFLAQHLNFFKKYFLLQNSILKYQNQICELSMPHTSMTLASLIGGGQSDEKGEIEKTGFGLLVLDELLEFKKEILEALRGPMNGQILQISKYKVDKKIQVNCQVIATTNLCPCGNWSPEKKAVSLSCRFGTRLCRGYLERLSGPLVDRFGLLYFCHHGPQQREFKTGPQILERIDHYCDAFRSIKVIEESSIMESAVSLSGVSKRRINALQKVALVFALERLFEQGQSEGRIEIEDYLKAKEWTLATFQRLEKGMC